MKLIKLVLLLFVGCFYMTVSQAIRIQQLKFFFKGIWYTAKDFAKDLITKHELEAYPRIDTYYQLFMQAGYAHEVHKIITEDGYINTAWRITGKRHRKDLTQSRTRPPIVLQHGLAESSATWLVQNLSISFPFRLVDEGFDVWILNNRGNINSHEHVNMTSHNYTER